MDDVSVMRFRNYKALMLQFRQQEAARGEPERGLLNRFGAFVGISPRYLSHLNNGRKAVGAQTARQMEKAFGLPEGWMDHDHIGGSATSSRAEREFLELALQLYRQSPVEAQSLLLRYVADRIIGGAMNGDKREERTVSARVRVPAKGGR